MESYNYVIFCVWLLSLGYFEVRPCCSDSSTWLLFIAGHYSIVCIYTICLSNEWTFGLLQLLATVNSAAVNKHAHVFVSVPVFNSFVYKPRSRIVGSCSNSLFNFCRTAEIFSTATILHNQLHCTRVLLSPQPHHTCYFPFKKKL